MDSAQLYQAGIAYRERRERAIAKLGKRGMTPADAVRRFENQRADEDAMTAHEKMVKRAWTMGYEDSIEANFEEH